MLAKSRRSNLALVPARKGGLRLKITYDPDLPMSYRPLVKQEIKDSDITECECGSDEIYVSLVDSKTIDVKCYDCGNSFFELEVEIEEE